ncbi:MAG: hypothetical protein D6740_06745 [Alphaproteobacteria bacterium]|nr:MAG: hypothetical protein D6740_06745 [Alphaproteobacteria bacterium]
MFGISSRASSSIEAQTRWSEREDILRHLVADLFIEHRRWRALAPGTPRLGREIDFTAPLGEEGLGLDSLERLSLAARISEFFHLHETGAQDHLFDCVSLEDVVRVIAFAARQGVDRISVRSSGSTGPAKIISHSLHEIAIEADFWYSLVPGRQRVVTFVPTAHLYGFMFAAMLAGARGWPVLRAEEMGVPQTIRALLPGDLVVASPRLLARMAREELPLPPDVFVLSSGQALPPETASAIRKLGAERLIDSYGASEIGGIGWREDVREPFHLLPFLFPVPERQADEQPEDGRQKRAEGTLLELRKGNRRRSVRLEDHIRWVAERRFVLGGRVQPLVPAKGGALDLERVRAVLCSHPEVADAAVTLDRLANRLKAFVVPKAAVYDPERLARRLRRDLKPLLHPFEMPHDVRFGPEIPRDPLGKLMDW